MTAKGHITLQKYCFYVSWQNLDLNFQPCRLQNSNKTKRRLVRPKRRFTKIYRRLVFLKRRFDFLRIFVLIGRVGSCGFESKNHGLQIVATAQRRKTIGRIVLPIVFLCVALCDQIVLPGYTFRASSKHFTAAFKSSSLRTYAILACFLPFSGSE